MGKDLKMSEEEFNKICDEIKAVGEEKYGCNFVCSDKKNAIIPNKNKAVFDLCYVYLAKVELPLVEEAQKILEAHGATEVSFDGELVFNNTIAHHWAMATFQSNEAHKD